MKAFFIRRLSPSIYDECYKYDAKGGMSNNICLIKLISAYRHIKIMHFSGNPIFPTQLSILASTFDIHRPASLSGHYHESRKSKSRDVDGGRQHYQQNLSNRRQNIAVFAVPDFVEHLNILNTGGMKFIIFPERQTGSFISAI